jgi:hypothetical protein
LLRVRRFERRRSPQARTNGIRKIAFCPWDSSDIGRWTDLTSVIRVGEQGAYAKPA